MGDGEMNNGVRVAAADNTTGSLGYDKCRACDATNCANQSRMISMAAMRASASEFDAQLVHVPAA